MKRLKKNSLLLVLGFLLYRFLWVFDPMLAKVYDLVTQQSAVTEFSMDAYEHIHFNDLPPSEKAKYARETCAQTSFKNSIFLKITWFERYKNFSGTTKIHTLFTPDRLIKNRIRIPNLNKTQYLLIDSDVIEVYQKLITKLNDENLHTEEIKITSGFRNPAYNKMVNGATCSQHQFGTAIDISVGDLNGDGTANQADRKIIYDLLENELIGNTGGIGKYKNSPRLIHFDTRGNRARW